MIVTILDAKVESEKQGVLQKSYKSMAEPLPPEIVQSFLLQETDDQTHWRIVTIWQSEETLEEYRQSTDTPGGVLMFRSADAEPTLSVFKVIAVASTEE